MMIVFLGLSITSSWGNGHATTYRALIRALSRRGHRVVFLERDKPWYAENRDMPEPDFCRTVLYGSLEELRDEHGALIAGADAVLVGSFVPEGAAVGAWVQSAARGAVAFYDIDTPITLERLGRGECEYLSPELIPGYDPYLSFTGGPTLRVLESRYGSPRARALYCAVDAERYYPEGCEARWDLGYLGTYSDDRQPGLERLLIEPARRMPEAWMVVGGPQYPESVAWPPNVDRIEHVAPPEHRAFYCSQRATLNVTREAMRRVGYAPSVRLFEAAACGTAVLSDEWAGIEEVLTPGEEIVLVRSAGDVVEALSPGGRAALERIGRCGRQRILSQHTADHRAAELEGHLAAAPRAATVSTTVSTGGPVNGERRGSKRGSKRGGMSRIAT